MKNKKEIKDKRGKIIKIGDLLWYYNREYSSMGIYKVQWSDEWNDIIAFRIFPRRFNWLTKEVWKDCINLTGFFRKEDNKKEILPIEYFFRSAESTGEECESMKEIPKGLEESFLRGLPIRGWQNKELVDDTRYN